MADPEGSASLISTSRQSHSQSQSTTSATANSTTRAKGAKRKITPVFRNDPACYEDKDSGVVCPICCNVIESAYMTECGHSFCHRCIQASLESQNTCPKCSHTMKPHRIFPNFTLNEIIAQNKQRSAQQSKLLTESRTTGDAAGDISNIISKLLSDRMDVPVSQVTGLIELLTQKKQCLMLESEIGQTSLVLEFLRQVQDTKKKEAEKLQRELTVLAKDIESMEKKSYTLATQYKPSASLTNGTPTLERITDPQIRRRLNAHSSDLQEFYFNCRGQQLLGDTDCDGVGLDGFTSALSKFVRFSDLRQLATLNYTSDMYNMYSIVSSIEFDKDSDYFAIAGVTRKIKIYDYRQVVHDVVDMHYPISEMVCGSKISCVAWNPYHKNEMVSSDYEGHVTMWDPFTAKKLHLYQEHEKRCWCVDFSKMNPQLLASGSDDSKVKIWSTNTSHSILNIEAKANVCCVKFSPTSAHHLAFGCADHCVHYYDLRKTRQPLATFKGHSKAVSYTKFLNGEEIVSASTDSQLKLWNINQGTTAVRTFKGHTNEKNFVGLASDSDYIACGSEDNALCIYYKGLSKVLLKYRFEVVKSAWQREPPRDEDSSEFVSAITWKPDSNVIVVANSQGIVKILELI